ncbi:MAG: hypothetical protein ABW115_21045 [Candidatus Thiodiazotropha sp. 6PLUC6]
MRLRTEHQANEYTDAKCKDGAGDADQCPPTVQAAQGDGVFGQLHGVAPERRDSVLVSWAVRKPGGGEVEFLPPARKTVRLQSIFYAAKIGRIGFLCK